MGLVDPTTQLYQAVQAQLLNYAPFKTALRTIQDPSQTNFQQLLDSYQGGDTPAYLMLPTKDEDDVFNASSMSFAWKVEFALLMTTDYEAVQPLFSINWLRRCTFSQISPVNFGMQFVRKWDFVGGRMGLGRFQKEADAAAAGSKRWTTVGAFRFWCEFGWADLTALANQFAAQGPAV